MELVFSQNVKVFLHDKRIEVLVDVPDRELWSFLLEYWIDENYKMHHHKIPMIGLDETNGQFKIIWDKEWEIVRKWK
jgi:hypothetical protein